MAIQLKSYISLFFCVSSFAVQATTAATPLKECKSLFSDAHYKEAISSCTHAADAGDNSAQTMLGEIYDLEGNSSKTLQLWRKAADAGYQPARNLLALKYYYGGTVLGPEKGWTKDYSKAFEIWMKDANQDIATSQFMIGVMYQNGYGVTRDLSEAWYWLKRALANGYKLSTDVLIEISRDITPLQKQVGRKKLAEYQKNKAN